MQLLITEDESIVLGDSALRGLALVREKEELFDKLEGVALPLCEHALEQAGQEQG